MTFEDTKLRQYLLGSLSEEETEAIDMRCIEDDAFEPELSLAECDLISDYLDGTLSDAEHQLFRSNFMVTRERWEKLRDVSLLRGASRRGGKTDQRADGQAAGSLAAWFRAYLRPLLAGATVVAVILVGILLWRSYSANELSPLEVEYAELNKQDLTDLEMANGMSAVSLVSGNFRDANAAISRRASDLTDHILLRLALPNGSRPDSVYDAKLSRGSAVVFRLYGLRSYENSSGTEVRAIVPRSVLLPSDYGMELINGNSEIEGSYSFKITK